MSTDRVTGLQAPPEGLALPAARQVGAALARVAFSVAWSARHPRELFVERPVTAAAERLYYRAEDGWEAPVWRYAPRPGATGEPVLLAPGVGAGPLTFDYQEKVSLVHALQEAGYDVYVLEHRGDRHAVAPAEPAPMDFDAIASQDVPAALGLVRRISGAPRVLWVGHSMGGQLLYAHLANGGEVDVAAAISLCAPVRFDSPRSQARLAAAVARLLPEDLQIPATTISRALATVATPDRWAPLALDAEGPILRGFLVHGTADFGVGLARQVSRWLVSGTLCDRDDRLDYAAALEGLRLPLLVVAAEGDRICPPSAARPVLDHVHPADSSWLLLDETWGHVDPLLGRRAGRELFPRLLAWLEAWRDRAWAEGPG